MLCSSIKGTGSRKLLREQIGADSKREVVESKHQRIYFGTLTDGRGYYMDYDLTTSGKINDLTIQIEFLKKADGYIAVLDDLHTL